VTSAQQAPIPLPWRADVRTRCVMRDPRCRESNGIMMTEACHGCGISTRESA
jgi:hypothetical protein